jgi:hypothetical protein
VARVHGAQIEELDNRPRIRQLWGVVRWRSELLQQFPSHTGSGLFFLYHWAVAKVALHEKNHLVVSSKDLVAADVIEPPLHQRLDSDFVLVSTRPSGCKRWGDGWNERLRIRGNQMLGQLDELGVQAPDITELGGSKIGEIGLQDSVL